MGPDQVIQLLVTVVVLQGLLSVHAGSARALLQATSNHANSTAAAATGPSYPANCTPPRSVEATKQPFCVIPDNVSPGAREVLSVTAAGRSPLESTAANDDTAVLQMREWYYAFSINGSHAAAAEYLQSTRNDTIADVPVVFGVPKGGNSSSKPADDKLLIYLHGGAYIIGSCQSQLSTAVPTAARAGLTTLCVEYRLAPEHPFPAGLDDALAVYKQLLKQGYQSNNIVLLGDSAGGGLVAAVVIQLQREGLPLPAALGMMSPWADPDPAVVFDTAYTLIGVDPIIPPISSGLGSAADAYVGGNETLYADWLVSPRRANWVQLFPNNTLPPTLIQVGLRESLLSQVVQLYHNMKAAAPAPGHVSISPYDAMWHVFQASYMLPEAEAAHQEMADFFSWALNGTVCV